MAVANVEATGRPPKKCRFAEALGCTGIHPRWKCPAFGDIDPDEREKIIEDKKMCPFCLLHSVEDVCYTKLTDTKPACLRPECKGDHTVFNGCMPAILKAGTAILAPRAQSKKGA